MGISNMTTYTGTASELIVPNVPSYVGTASELMSQQLQINGVLLDNVGFCILARYGMIQCKGYQPRKTLENGRVAKGKPARVYELESKEWFVVSLGEAEATRSEETVVE